MRQRFLFVIIVSKRLKIVNVTLCVWVKAVSFKFLLPPLNQPQLLVNFGCYKLE